MVPAQQQNVTIPARKLRRMATAIPASNAHAASITTDISRNAISIGGDSDTLAAITGSIAQAYYGIPKFMREQALTYLDNNLRPILDEFEARYM